MSEIILDKKKLSIQWSVALILPLSAFILSWYLGYPAIVSAFLSVTLCALSLWAMNLMSDALVAIALPVFYIVMGVGKPDEILLGWASPIGWIMLGGLTITLLMMETGLAKRLALKALSITKGSFNLLLLGLVLAGFMIAPAIPSLMGKVALICAICLGVCEALDIERNSRESAAIMFAGFIGVTASKFGFLTGGGDVVLLTSQISQTVSEISFSWGLYFVQQFVPSVIYALISLLCVILILKPKVDKDIASFSAQERQKLGPMSIDEKKTMGMLLVLVFLLMGDSFHGINPGWIMVLAAFTMALPGINLLTNKRLSSLNLLPVFFVVGCMAIGNGAAALGVDKAFAKALMPYFEGGSELGTMLMGYFAGTVLNFLLTPVPAISSMTVPLTELTLNLGLNPKPILFAFMYGLDQYIFPYEFVGLLYFYATGWIKLKDIMLVFSLRFIATGFFIVLVCYPWWKLTGFV